MFKIEWRYTDRDHRWTVLGDARPEWTERFASKCEAEKAARKLFDVKRELEIRILPVGGAL